MSRAHATFPIPDISRNGSSTADALQQSTQGSRWQRIVVMAKTPTTLPRWSLLLTHGALAATVIVGAISYGRSSQATVQALSKADKVPAIQETTDTLKNEIAELKKSVNENTATVIKLVEAQNAKVDSIQQQVNTVQSLKDQVATMQNQMGSIWALAQSDSNKVSELKGKADALQSQMSQLMIQMQQQRKDK